MIWKMIRCFIVQGVGRALLWILMLGAAGYAAYKTTECPQGQICVQEQKRR